MGENENANNVRGLHIMIMRALFGAFVLLSIVHAAPAQVHANSSSRRQLGLLANGAAVTFVRAGSGDWGIEISIRPGALLSQETPAQIEFYRGDEDVRDFAAGYQSVQKDTNGLIAKANVSCDGDAAFAVEDKWKIAGDVLLLDRRVRVTSGNDKAGFYSAIRLSSTPAVKWPNAKYFAPGLLYGDPTYDGDTSPGGELNYRAKRFEFREDQLSAPLFAISFPDKSWAAVMDLAPRGDTTWAEATGGVADAVIDERVQFGALGAREGPTSGVEFGFWFPGNTREFARGLEAPSFPVVRHRYHPVKPGFTQSYQVAFRFGESNSFLGMERDAWRWAWQALRPPAMHLDLEIVRRALTDHLDDRVLRVNGLAGVPFLFDAVTGNPGSYRNWNRYRNSFPTPPSRPANTPITAHELSPERSAELADWARTAGIHVDPGANELEQWPKIIMGFVSKGVEAGDQLLIEGDRDRGPRGQKMREDGLAIIGSFIRLVPLSPPAGEGFNVWAGKADSWAGDTVTLRGPSEGTRTLLDAYRREKQKGRDHPDWLALCRQFGDWLLTQQREDGSFPRSWHGGTGEVLEASGTSSYNPVPMLVKLSRETGQRRYLEAAIRAANYVWDKYGSRGVFVGGATDNPNITDKEAGMLSLDAFLDLYDATKNPKWLRRAEAAGNYAETYIWIWNVPMPLDAIDSDLNWKRGVPTVGVQGITARAVGGVDEYLDWAVPDYARLYKCTHDQHYFDVARILLFDTKSMMALPGRTYDLLGPGWQQEHWGMSINRGFGTHRSWLPWVSVNHLHGITGLQEFDPALYRRLANGN
jgi:hypothetical protein